MAIRGWDCVAGVLHYLVISSASTRLAAHSGQRDICTRAKGHWARNVFWAENDFCVRFDQCLPKLAAAEPHRTLLIVSVAGVRSPSGWLPS